MNVYRELAHTPATRRYEALELARDIIQWRVGSMTLVELRSIEHFDLETFEMIAMRAGSRMFEKPTIAMVVKVSGMRARFRVAREALQRDLDRRLIAASCWSDSPRFISYVEPTA